jgi:hypothetical protein
MSTTSWVVFGNPFAFPSLLFTRTRYHLFTLIHTHPPTQLLFHIFHSCFEQQILIERSTKEIHKIRLRKSNKQINGVSKQIPDPTAIRKTKHNQWNTPNITVKTKHFSLFCSLCSYFLSTFILTNSSSFQILTSGFCFYFSVKTCLCVHFRSLSTMTKKHTHRLKALQIVC